MTMNYTEKFNEYTNVELLRIIDNPYDFQPDAVETASTLLANRQLSEEEIEIAKDEIEASKKETFTKEKKKKQFEDSIKNISQTIIENVNPIQNKPLTGDKTINIISIIFGGLFLIQLYKEFSMISFMFSNNSAEWDLSMVFYFLPLIVLPTAIFLFYKRKKIGWLILTIFTTYSTISAIGLFYMTMKMRQSDFHLFENIFTETSPVIQFFRFLFFVGTTWAISKENVRSNFAINKLTMILTVSITTLIIGLGLYLFL